MVDACSSPLSEAAAVDVQATFCSTLVDQWLRLGVRHAVVAPGSRSTPMALALAERAEMRVHVVHDERVAAFVALGLGLATGTHRAGVPALLLCTSGTAAANFLPAVVEAGLSEVPMIALTADRPEELRGVGAPQTIDQIELYGTHVRWFHDPGVAEVEGSGEWRRLAASVVAHSLAGPVQLNLPFREPLVGAPHDLPAVDESADEMVDGSLIAELTLDDVPDAVSSERGVILVGGRSGVEVDQVLALRDGTGWPVIADPQSGMRHLGDVCAVDALLRTPDFPDRYRPDVIVRVGRPSTSKVLAQWTARPEPTLIQVGGPGRIDPSGSVAAVCAIGDVVAAAARDRPSTDWLHAWRHHEQVAQAGIARVVGRGNVLSEPAVARSLVAHLPVGAQLTVSSSMPIRDVEWYGGPSPLVHANRGANGIDGVVSTAVGRALAESSPSFVLIGDLAFVHDSNALVALVPRGVDLRVVVVDNDGGGIFSFLPQSTLLDHDRFESLFGTPLGTDVLALAAAHGIETATATTIEQLVRQISRPGPWVCRVPSDRGENIAIHDQIHEAVAEAIARETA